MVYNDKYYANISLFQPRSRIQSSSVPLYFTLNTGLREGRDYDVGVSYLYSIADSNLFQYNKGFGGFLYHSIHSHVPGFSAYTNLKYKKFTTYITYVSALTTFDTNELSYQGHAARPMAVSMQSGYEMLLVKNIPARAIIFYDTSFQALALRLPKERIGIGLDIYPSRYADIQLQLSRDYNYASGVVASGLNTRVTGNSSRTSTLALQLILNF